MSRVAKMNAYTKAVASGWFPDMTKAKVVRGKKIRCSVCGDEDVWETVKVTGIKNTFRICYGCLCIMENAMKKMVEDRD